MLEINTQNKALTKKQEIVNTIEKAVENKKIRKGDKLPSLNAIKANFSVSRDTAIDAYNELKSRGIIHSIVGKGYYLANEKIDTIQKIFVLFDELNAFKETLYKSLIEHLGSNAEVEIFFHHFNKKTFKTIIENSISKYSHYVIMPANLKKVSQLIQGLPQNKVYILDQMHKDLETYPVIYQNFESGLFKGLQQLINSIVKYNHFTMIYDSSIQPEGILKGFKLFCDTHQIDYSITGSNKEITVIKDTLYLTLDDSTLITIIKQIKQQNLQIAKEVGIIAYNDTPLKEIIADGITSISTDFSIMGKTLAEMITQGKKDTIENNISVTLRHSL